MTTIATPPPPPSAPGPSSAGGPPAPAQPNSALRGVLLLIGSALLIGILAMTGVRVAMLIGSEDASGMHQITDPVQSLSVRTSATDVQVSFADVQHPEIELQQGRQDLTMRHQVRNGELSIVIESPWRGIALLRPSFSRTDRNQLQVRLPQDLARADLELRTTAGEVTADGDFGALSVNATASDVHLAGSADSLRVDTTATEVIARDFATSGTVRADTTAGDLHYQASELPSAIDVNGTATDVLFELPRGEYEIVTNTTAAGLTQDVPSTAGAEYIYRFNVTAGSVHLTERP